MDKSFSKIQNKNKDESVYRYFSQPKRDCLYKSRKNLIKNYVLDPDAKLVL
jgi:hypothetical protein